ncbi:cytochrome P450 [Kitasatospora sp. NPDC096147]|uniref:cytochrome P450 n=1 Tax=Kitasatospora sp. NPDC096147 TaxID=3364093 RepID=UPI00380265A4
MTLDQEPAEERALGSDAGSVAGVGVGSGAGSTVSAREGDRTRDPERTQAQERTQDQERANRIFLPATYAEGVPYPLYAHYREREPVRWVEEPAVGDWPSGPGYWAVLRHADVRHVLRTPSTYSSHLGATQIRDPDSAADLDFARTMMLNQDPPDHSRLRRIVAGAFTPRALRELTAGIEERATAVVRRARDLGATLDLVPLAADLPVWTLARIMGVPDEDRALLAGWADRVIGYQDAAHAHAPAPVGAGAVDAGAEVGAAPSGLSALGRSAVAVRPRPEHLVRPDGRPVNPRSRAALADMFAYAHGLARRPRPGSILARMVEAGLTEEEFETTFFLFAVAGNETLRNGVPGGLHVLLAHPEEYRRLRADPARTPAVVEEMLRYWPPVLSFRRTATHDVELGGRRLRRGDKVVVYHAAANRDPAVFPDPDRFDPDRFDVGRSESDRFGADRGGAARSGGAARPSQDHVSFGDGPHFCLGAQLARVQMRALVREIATTLPELEPAGEPVRLVSNFQNGLRSLPVRVR